MPQSDPPTPSIRWRKIGCPVISSSYSSRRDSTVSQITMTSSSQPSGRSAAVPPGRMKLLFILQPARLLEERRATSSRSRNPKIIIVVEPTSMPFVASHIRCDDIRCNSDRSIRIHDRPRRQLDAEQCLGGHREHELVVERGQVVHSCHVRSDPWTYVSSSPVFSMPVCR